MAAEAERLLNKARPLVADGGQLVLVNNALFVSGAEQMALIEAACSDGYLTLERTIAVPDDVVGLSPSSSAALPADPAPFNHPTKIAILAVKRKDGRTA
jgi:23S rRNA (cytosine1962-C5)-methyltransferase